MPNPEHRNANLKITVRIGFGFRVSEFGVLSGFGTQNSDLKLKKHIALTFLDNPPIAAGNLDK
jgi:hypothetical protein